MKKLEGSKTDKTADRKGAAKLGVPVRKVEGSRKDREADAVVKRVVAGKKAW